MGLCVFVLLYKFGGLVFAFLRLFLLVTQYKNTCIMYSGCIGVYVQRGCTIILRYTVSVCIMYSIQVLISCRPVGWLNDPLGLFATKKKIYTHIYSIIEAPSYENTTLIF